MVFNVDLLTIGLVLWIGAITAWILWREIRFRHFFGKTDRRNIQVLLEELVVHIGGNDALVKEIKKELDNKTLADFKHVQKVGLVKFNPFRDAGGNQSFALALLNDENSGFVLTGLHARETTRLYVKDVQKGTSKSELSGEEKKAIEVAIKG